MDGRIAHRRRRRAPVREGTRLATGMRVSRRWRSDDDGSDGWRRRRGKAGRRSLNFADVIDKTHAVRRVADFYFARSPRGVVGVLIGRPVEEAALLFTR